MTTRFSIRAVAEETGLSVHTIRAWERRYGVISPVRTESNRRVYDERDVLRLKLLHRAVEAGHSIGMIADLTTEDLGRLANATDRPSSNPNETAPKLIVQAMQALETLDASTFEAVLVRASFVFGIDSMVDDLIAPLMMNVGRKWEAGELTIAQEHMASAVVRTHLERTRLSIRSSRNAPKLIAATPSGQQHEIGAMMAAIVAAAMDWNVTYLGPNLPAEEIAEAASKMKASAVALSLVHPRGDRTVENELRKLGRLLPKDSPLVVGGEAAGSYGSVLGEIGATACHDFDTLRDWLNTQRAATADLL